MTVSVRVCGNLRSVSHIEIGYPLPKNILKEAEQTYREVKDVKEAPLEYYDKGQWYPLE